MTRCWCWTIKACIRRLFVPFNRSGRLVEGLAQPDDQHSIEGFLGARFSRDKHCLPGIVSQIWHGRDEAKRQHNKPLSQALKIIMNAFYGVLGTSACRFFDPRLASSITMRGHAIMRQTKALIEAKGYDVIYGDTDSTFVWLKRPHSEAQAAEIGRELVSHVNAWWAQELSKASLPAPWSWSMKPTSAAFNADDPRRRYRQQEALCRDDSGGRCPAHGV